MTLVQITTFGIARKSTGKASRNAIRPRQPPTYLKT